MNATVTGKFSAVKQATRAVDKLLESCVSDDRVRTIVLKSSAERPAANTSEKSSRPRSHGVTAPQAAAGGGPLDSIGDDERRSSDRPAGILVAVETPDRVSRALAVSVLRQHGARIIESDEDALPDKNSPDARPVPLSALFKKSDAEKKQSAGFVPIEIERPSSFNGALRTGSGVREHGGRQQATGSSGHKDSLGKR
jgi:hypothetical protein